MIPEPLVNATVLLVDDEVDHLQLRAGVMKVRGFTVITAGDPVKAISIMAETMETIDIAVLDYHMPVMNGCLLADRLRSICPEVKIILNSGALDIPQDEMASVDVFIPKGDGMTRLLAQVVEFAQPGPEPSEGLAGGDELCFRMRSGQF